MSADPQPKRTRRAEPITKGRGHRGETVYSFRVDVGTRPDGSRERQRFTFSTLAEARREYRRITTEVAAGTFVRRDKTTVGVFLAGWLDGRRDLRPGTLAGYRFALKPVIDHVGAVPLQHLRTADLDALTTLRMAGQPVAQSDKRGRRSAEVLTWLRARPDGASYGEMFAEFGNAGEKALARLVASGEVTRPARGRYAAARPADPERPKVAGGVSARTVVTMLVVLSSALDDAVAQGLVARNVARLVKRPKIAAAEMAFWTPDEAERFRVHISSDRLAACWLLTLAGLRRSEVLGLRWADVDFDAGTITIAQGRVVVGGGTVTGAPKSMRSARTLPMPPVLEAALRAFRTRQAEERLALGGGWPDTGLVAVNADGSPIRPETYSKAFAAHCAAAGVPVIRLHDVRHTAATMLLDGGTTPSATAKWLGHDPAITLRVYGHVYDDALASAGDALLGRSRASGDEA
ncbi:integrase [Mycobacterium kubicae]|uniref:Integrase n=1 Tax=Mycobacterium kubicae TaxID=120959 RepID=A0AAX1J6E5_9MYCO|nr:site-specific integrase [Mycobacterium kubicae]MCV7094111.1 site-specific integrase [Mycobacterium kubicae]ORV98456.1 integrase [Mycobacterium kubicae]QNI12551.1 site-specific integrase [Mycobacterium kubicae]QPI36075.1 site-specific integrase [Mycobacterium kubicae]GFG68080.1 integrase [Mycobacterium kubicae]